MPRVSLDPSYDPNPINEPGTTIAGDPYFDDTLTNPYLGITPVYGGNVPVELIEPIDPVVPIENNPANPINVLVEPIREDVLVTDTLVIATSNQSVIPTTAPSLTTSSLTTSSSPSSSPSSSTTSVPGKPNAALMGGGGGGGKSGSSVGSDLKTTDKKYWWWIAVAVVGVGLYSYKKSK